MAHRPTSECHNHKESYELQVLVDYGLVIRERGHHTFRETRLGKEAITRFFMFLKKVLREHRGTPRLEKSPQA